MGFWLKSPCQNKRQQLWPDFFVISVLPWLPLVRVCYRGGLLPRPLWATARGTPFILGSDGVCALGKFNRMVLESLSWLGAPPCRVCFRLVPRPGVINLHTPVL